MKQIDLWNFRVQTNEFEISADSNGLEMNLAKGISFNFSLSKGIVFVEIDLAKGTIFVKHSLANWLLDLNLPWNSYKNSAYFKIVPIFNEFCG